MLITESKRERERETYLDGMKAFCIVGIVFIHTTFWSGGSYVPEWVRNLSLLFDVPAFFYITGAVLGQQRLKPDFVLAQAFKLSILFTGAIITIQILFFAPSLSNIIDALFLQQAAIPQFPVLRGSYWFVPIYIKSLFLCLVLIKFLPRIIPVYIFWGSIYIILHSFTTIKPHVFLGSELRIVIFYSLFVLLGYKLYGRKKRNFWLAVLALSCAFSAFFWLMTPNFSMQGYKFPPTFVWGIYSLISISLFMLFRRPIHSRILLWMGKNALSLYMSQGISSSLIFNIVPHINITLWQMKLVVMFSINLSLSLLIGWFLSWYFARIASFRLISFWRGIGDA